MSAPDLKTNAQADIWRMASGLPNFTIAELTIAAQHPVQTVRFQVTGWLRDGHAIEVGQDTGSAGASPKRFSVIKSKTKPFGPKLQRIWQSIRRNPNFSVVDIAAFATIPEEEVTMEEVQKYIRMLLDAGYVRQTVAARRGEGPARYKLVKNTGPRPIEARRITVTLDLNTGEVIPPKALRTGQPA